MFPYALWRDFCFGPGMARFAQDADHYLAEIARQLESGTYEPGRLTPVALPRPDGQLRMLYVPTVRDRVVERSILAVVTPLIDPWLGPFSYAYRPGLGARTPPRPSPYCGMRACAG
jgi:retron-type reverse transcriptase